MMNGPTSPCCTDRRCGRTEPDPCSGLCDADVFWASQLQHPVQHVGRDGHVWTMCGRPPRCKEKMEDQQLGQVRPCSRPLTVRYSVQRAMMNSTERVPLPPQHILCRGHLG